jgi:hypothetical protein
MWFVVKPLTLQELAATFPELVKPRLAAVIRGHAYAPGPAQADRTHAVADADARILEIEDEHTRLVDPAATFEPPIVLELLPSVKGRRAAEQVERERMARAAVAENRVAREAAANQQHERRVTPSAYITGTDRP